MHDIPADVDPIKWSLRMIFTLETKKMEHIAPLDLGLIN
jgi:hypothetical protein